MVGRVWMCVGGAVGAAEVAVVARWGRAVRQSVPASLALETSTVGWPACVIIVSSAAYLYTVHTALLPTARTCCVW